MDRSLNWWSKEGLWTGPWVPVSGDKRTRTDPESVRATVALSSSRRDENTCTIVTLRCRVQRRKYFHKRTTPLKQRRSSPGKTGFTFDESLKICALRATQQMLKVCGLSFSPTKSFLKTCDQHVCCSSIIVLFHQRQTRFRSSSFS